MLNVSQIQWTNFIVNSKFAKNSDGHIDASTLWERIMSFDSGEAYYCAFDLEKRPTFKQYQGLVRAALGLVNFDLDGANALNELRSFIKEIKAAGGDEKYMIAFFSGSKGFHLCLPYTYFGLAEMSVNFHKILGEAANTLNKKFPTLDTSVYNANRKFRLPGSQHDKTNLFKIRLSYDEIMSLDLEAIKEKAKTKIPFSLPLLEEIKKLEPLDYFKNILANVNVKNIEENSGKKADFSIYEKQKNKKCIEAMLKDRAPDGHKQNIAIRIIADLYNTGMHMRDALNTMHEWCKKNGITDDKVERTVEQIYTSEEPYSYGCNDNYKKERCSGKCPVYKHLTKEVRPQVLDAPVAVMKDAGPTKTEAEIAKEILSFFDGRLCQQERCLFIYKGTHWVELKPWEQNEIKIRLQTVLINEDLDSDSRRVESLFKTLMYYVPMVPTKYSLFKPSALALNFLNGTLHLIKTTKGENYEYSLEFLPHKKEDYLINVLPFEYSDDWSETNTEFLAMLGRIFDGDEDKEMKIRAVQQMYGACLVPKFPRIFYLNGQGTTGKSSIIKIAMKLVSQENIAGVDPTEFSGFAMETMIGKLVNAVTDVVVNQTIVDSRVKQIIDQVPMHINRKGAKYVYATLPAIHIFGGNGIPMTNDGASGAHERRWTFIQCNKVQVKNGTQYNKDFDQWVWEQGPRGILNFALMGLKDLLDNHGHYVVPDSGREAMADWQLEGDVVGEFLEDLKKGDVEYDGVRLVFSNDAAAKIRQKTLYEMFFKWSEMSGYRNKTITRHRFCRELDRKKVVRCVVDGVDHRRGIVEENRQERITKTVVDTVGSDF